MSVQAVVLLQALKDELGMSYLFVPTTCMSSGCCPTG
jgi:hypothetical protein